MSVVQAKIRPDSSTTSGGNMVTRPRNPSKPALRMRRSFCGIVHSPRLSPQPISVPTEHMWRRTGGSAFCLVLFFLLFALAMACLSSGEGSTGS